MMVSKGVDRCVQAGVEPKQVLFFAFFFFVLPVSFFVVVVVVVVVFPAL